MVDDVERRGEETEPTADEPLNREQRRAARFRPNANKPDPHAMSGPVPNEQAALEGDDDEAATKSGSGDVTSMTGAGTGGATESGSRQPHHEGAHFGNQPNS